MPNINLIAERRAEKRRMERLSKQLFYAMGASLAILVSVGSYLMTARFKQMGDVADADHRMDKVRPIIDEIDRVKKETSDKQPKVATLERARFDTLRWTLLFQAVAQSLPKDVWLTTIGAPEGEPIVVSLSGSAPSQAIAGQVALNLKSKPLFERVELLSTNLLDKGGRFGFQINAPIKPISLPAAPPPPAEAKKTAKVATDKGDNSRV